LGADPTRIACARTVQSVMGERAAAPLHSVPGDLRQALAACDADVRAAWRGLTPLARNEWVCWISSPKRAQTRERRIQRAAEDLKRGKRRPCCWPGCPHRRPTALKWFGPRQRKAQGGPVASAAAL
jgi:hypothetical protein